MGALGGDHTWPRNAAGPADVTCGLHRLQQALGTPRGEVALDLTTGRRIVSAEQRRRVAHDVVLHDADAREGKEVEPVLGAEERLGVGQQLVHVVARRVDEAEHPPTPPVLVALLHRDQQLHDLRLGQSDLGHGRMGERFHGAFLARAEGSVTTT